MKQQPVALILMPVYNVPERLFANSLNSVLEQTYPHIRLMLHDDGSNAATKAQLADFAGAHPELVDLCTEPQNGGIAHTRNRLQQRVRAYFEGVDTPSGVVIWLDADDCFSSKDFVSAVVSRMEEASADVCLLQFNLIFNNLDKYPYELDFDDYEPKTSPDFIEKHGEINTMRLHNARDDLRSLAYTIESTPEHFVLTNARTLTSSTLCWSRCYSARAFLRQKEVQEEIMVDGKPYKYAFEDYLYNEVFLYPSTRVTALFKHEPRIYYYLHPGSITGTPREVDFVVTRYERIREFMELARDIGPEAHKLGLVFLDWKADEVVNIVMPPFLSKNLIRPEVRGIFSEKIAKLRAEHEAEIERESRK